jgi:hypothetical protein
MRLCVSARTLLLLFLLLLLPPFVLLVSVAVAVVGGCSFLGDTLPTAIARLVSSGLASLTQLDGCLLTTWFPTDAFTCTGGILWVARARCWGLVGGGGRVRWVWLGSTTTTTPQAFVITSLDCFPAGSQITNRCVCVFGGACGWRVGVCICVFVCVRLCVCCVSVCVSTGFLDLRVHVCRCVGMTVRLGGRVHMVPGRRLVARVLALV